MPTAINGSYQIQASSIPQNRLNLSAPINPNDAVRLQDLQGYASGFVLKSPCRTSTQAVTDVPFSSFSSGTNTITTSAAVTVIDGITLAVGDRVLIKSYTGTNAAYNGIYSYTSTTGTAQFTRTADANVSGGTNAGASIGVGTLVLVEDGSAGVGQVWMVQPPAVGTDTITLNTSAINFGLIIGKNPNGTPADNEVPGGTPNGTLTTFTLAYTPILGSVKLFVSGIRQTLNTDFTVTGTTITMVTAPASTDTLLADYRR